MQAKIIRIEEPDFGCEGRMPGTVVMDKVILQNITTGEQMAVETSDIWLYEEDINEGDLVEVEESTGRIIRKVGGK